jgi:hypothetical protein
VEAAFPGHSLECFALDGLLLGQPAQSFAMDDSEAPAAVAAAASKPWTPLERHSGFVPAEELADGGSNVAVLSVAGLALEFHFRKPQAPTGGAEEGDGGAWLCACATSHLRAAPFEVTRRRGAAAPRLPLARARTHPPASPIAAPLRVALQ